MAEMFVALNADHEPEHFGYTYGTGHMVLIPAGFQGDPLAGDTDGKHKTVCGRWLNTEALERKYRGDNHLCKRCKATDAVRDAALADIAEQESGESVADMIMSDPGAKVITLGGVSQSGFTYKGHTYPSMQEATAAYYADGNPVPDVMVSLPDPHVHAPELSGQTTATLTDTGKCTVKGRHEVKAVEGTDTDGLTGQCPTCRTVGVTLTGKGFIGAHRIGGTPAPTTSVLKESLPPVIDEGATRATTIGARDGNGHMDGAPLVRGRSMDAKPPKDHTGEDGARKSQPTTMEAPLGRDRIDDELRERPDKGRFTRTQRRNWQRKQARRRKAQQKACNRG